MLRARGHAVWVAPLLQMEAISLPVPTGEWTGVLVTSANAIRALDDAALRALCDLPLLAVGDRTAEAARAAGFTNVRSAAGHAENLVPLAAAAFCDTSGPVLYLAGGHRAHDLAAALYRCGVSVHTAVIYRMHAEARFPSAVQAELTAERIGGVLHYSRRTALTYLDCAAAGDCVRAALAPVHYCLSSDVAAPIRTARAQHVEVAAHPDEPALLQLIATS